MRSIRVLLAGAPVGSGARPDRSAKRASAPHPDPGALRRGRARHRGRRSTGRPRRGRGERTFDRRARGRL